MLRFLITLVCDIFTIAISTIMVYKSWYWFILPVFPIGIYISYEQALGLLMVLNLFRSSSSMSLSWSLEEANKEEVLKCSLMRPFILAGTLLIFYIVHLCIS